VNRYEPRRISLAAALLTVGSVLAGEAATTETNAQPSGPAEPGLEFAGMLWRPEISLSPMYDSNIYALPSREIADWIWILSPTVNGESEGDSHRIRVDAGAQLGRYAEYDSEDYDDWWVDAEGRYDLAPATRVFGGIGFAQKHEERGSADAVAPAADLAFIEAEPTVYTSLTADTGVTHQLGDTALRAGVTFQRLDYDDVQSLAGSTVDNDDRDRDVFGIAVRLSRRLAGSGELFAHAIWNKREYAQVPDDYGYRRDSDGYRLAVGFKGPLRQGLDAEGYVGYLAQDFTDSRFDHIGTLDFGAKLNWRVDAETRAKLTLERSLNETTLEGSSSYLYSSLNASVSHTLGAGTSLFVNLGAALAEYQDVGRDDWLYSAGVGVQRMLGRHVYVAGGYRFARRDSNEHDGTAFLGPDLYDYDRHQVYLTVGALGY
jgi:hypothetical protein